MRGSGIAIVLLVGALAGCGGPSQIGPDREVFRTVDALYTAISLRELPPVERCEGTLQELRTEGKLPEAAAESLSGIIQKAREGAWETAQERLNDFMLGQRG